MTTFTLNGKIYQYNSETARFRVQIGYVNKNNENIYNKSYMFLGPMQAMSWFNGFNVDDKHVKRLSYQPAYGCGWHGLVTIRGV